HSGLPEDRRQRPPHELRNDVTEQGESDDRRRVEGRPGRGAPLGGRRAEPAVRGGRAPSRVRSSARARGDRGTRAGKTPRAHLRERAAPQPRRDRRASVRPVAGGGRSSAGGGGAVPARAGGGRRAAVRRYEPGDVEAPPPAALLNPSSVIFSAWNNSGPLP